MYITKTYAKQIVADVEQVIQKKINLMDSDAIIIASTDESRIGEFHEGAYKVISENLGILVVKEQNELAGAWPGINLPIVIEGNLIGVIGITSEQEEDLKLGKIIKKLTEMLVFELYLKEQSDLKIRARNAFVEEWISGGDAVDESFPVRGNLVGIDINQPNRSVVGHIDFVKSDPLSLEAFEIQQLRDQIFQFIAKQLAEEKLGYLVSIGSELVFLLRADSVQMASTFLMGIKAQIEKQFPVVFYCGIGRSVALVTSMHHSYIEARQSMSIARKSMTGIAAYEEMTLEYLLNELPLDAKKQYVHRVFEGCSLNEIKEWTNVLTLFFANNYSLNSAAAALFIHKNTLQYQLNKIARRTGFDPRNARDGVTLYVAILIQQFTMP